MKMHTLCACGIAIAIVAARPAAKDAVFFMELPLETLPQDVGANVFSTVGTFYQGGALTWMPTSGSTDLGGRGAVAVSKDGRTIIGEALDARGFENAAIYEGNKRWRVLGSFTPGAQACDRLLSGAYGASDDGRVIVGLGWDGCRYAHAFRWEESTGMVDLGSTNARSSRANNVSGDGRVVVGFQESDVGIRQGARWVGGRQQLFRGPSGEVAGEAHAANRDGSIIVGHICDYAETDRNIVSTAWKWTEPGGIKCLPMRRRSDMPNQPYIAMALATSDDGRVLGGSMSFGLDAESVIWIDDDGQYLEDYLQANGHPDAFRGWVNTGFITGVSPDGRTLVGYGAGLRGFTGFVVVLPELGDRP